MSSRIGSGYIGSSDLITSTVNLEIIPSPPVGWSVGYSLYKFALSNTEQCHVKINGGNPILLAALQGFSMDSIDAPISSFVIVESGITFNWIGAY